MVIKTLAKSVRQYTKNSIQTPVLVALEVVLECIIPMLMAQLIDNMTGNTLSPVIKYGAALVGMAMLSLLFGYWAGKVAATASCGFAKNLRGDLYNKVQDFAFADVDKFSTSSLVTRMTTDVTNVQNAYQMIIRIAVRTPLMLVFSMAMSFFINWQIALIFLAILPVLGISLFLILFKVMPFFTRVFKKYDNMNSSIQENVSGIRVVKSFVREDYEMKKFKYAAEDVQKDFTKAEKIIALCNPVMMFCIYLAMLLVSFFGAKLIINSAGTGLSTGELSSLISYGVQILSSMMMLSMVFVMCSMAAESAKRISEVIEHVPSLESPSEGDTVIQDGSITFENVSFRYSEKAEKNALEYINFSIKSGETLGILGGTGASKTTLIQLIPRLYDTSSGRVIVGGKDVKEYDLEALRNEVAVVLQKNILFSGTIKENLRWGNKDASDEDLVRVCKLAQADDFISQFPDKYDTYIEQGGTNVSGGQKQRLCIARALLKAPKILILDDSTSAVDTKTDAQIRKALSESIPHTTKIIIAQRLSSVEDANKVIVLEGGKIAEMGTPKELYNMRGIYREIYDAQNSAKEVK